MSLATLAPVISGLAWTVTYAGVVTRTYKDKVPGMPLAALCLNFAWETTYSIIYPPQSSLVETLINVVWMILNALIVIGMLRFGPKDYQQRLGISKGTFYATFALGLVASFGVMLLGPSYFGGLPAFHHDSFEVAKFIKILGEIPTFSNVGGKPATPLFCKIGLASKIKCTNNCSLCKV